MKNGWVLNMFSLLVIQGREKRIIKSVFLTIKVMPSTLWTFTSTSEHYLYRTKRGSLMVTQMMAQDKWQWGRHKCRSTKITLTVTPGKFMASIYSSQVLYFVLLPTKSPKDWNDCNHFCQSYLQCHFSHMSWLFLISLILRKS